MDKTLGKMLPYMGIDMNIQTWNHLLLKSHSGRL